MSVLNQMKDSCEIYTESAGDFGKSEVVTYVGRVDGLAQIMLFEEARNYKTESEKEIYKVFFNSDPGIKSKHWLKITSASLGKTFWMRVLATSIQANPKGTLRLWRVVGQEERSPTLAL